MGQPVHSQWAIIEGVAKSLASITNIPQITEPRWLLELYEDDTLPLIVVAPGPAHRKLGRGKPPQQKTMANSIFKNYNIQVGLYWPKNRQANAQLQAFWDIVDQIDYQLFQSNFPYVPVVSEFSWDYLDPQSVAVIQKSGVQPFGWDLWYCVSEPRAS